MEGYSKFSREWANDRDEKNKELQKNYLEEFQKNQSTMFQEMVKEPEKQQLKELASETSKEEINTQNNEIHMVESDKQVDETQKNLPPETHKRKKSPRAVMAMLVGLLAIVCIVVMTGYKATNGQKNETNAEKEEVRNLIEKYEKGIEQKSSETVMNSFSDERKSDIYDLASAYNESVDEYLFPYETYFSYKIVSIEKPGEDDNDALSAGDYMVRCEENYDDELKTVEYRIRKNMDDDWRIISSEKL